VLTDPEEWEGGHMGCIVSLTNTARERESHGGERADRDGGLAIWFGSMHVGTLARLVNGQLPGAGHALCVALAARRHAVAGPQCLVRTGCGLQHACLLQTGLVCRVPQQMLSSSALEPVPFPHWSLCLFSVWSVSSTWYSCMGFLIAAAHVVGAEPSRIG
jgi:hypothetical protein